MARKRVGAECSVKAEAIVFLDYSKDFPIRGRAGLQLGEGSPSDFLAVLAGKNASPAWRGPAIENPIFHAGRGKASYTRTVTWPRPPREAPK
jgi:hypothetical protein